MLKTASNELRTLYSHFHPKTELRTQDIQTFEIFIKFLIEKKIYLCEKKEYKDGSEYWENKNWKELTLGFLGIILENIAGTGSCGVNVRLGECGEVCCLGCIFYSLREGSKELSQEEAGLYQLLNSDHYII